MFSGFVRPAFRLGLGLAAVLALAGTAAADEETKTYRGATAFPAVRPAVIDIDLSAVPTVPEWQPGDPIKEIPRRHTHPIPEGFQPAPPIQGAEDGLLRAQESEAPGTDRAFTTPILNMDGQGFTSVNPADPSADVGPNHFITLINSAAGTSVTIYNKAGAILSGPFTLASTLGGTGNCASGLGDPVVLHDHLADRWLLSEFSATANTLCVYISQTADPVAGGWYRYAFNTPDFPDYPKYAVWPDAYYVSTNENSPAVYALDRTKMLAGLAATSQRFTAPPIAGFGFQALTPPDLDGPAPPAGAPAPFMRHRDDEAHNPPGTANDYLEVWDFHVDWVTPANSTFTGPTNIAVTDFSSDLCGFFTFSCIPMPGTGTRLDPLREVIMFRLAYRNFGTHRALIGNLVTNLTPPPPTGNLRAGVRWFELHKRGSGPWTLFQEGTYSPDTNHRWMGGSAMDQDRNFAVAYSISSSSVNPGLRYAGRLWNDTLGTLPQGEATIVNGATANGSNRWGDYFQMGVDPSDNCTFWFYGAYSPTSQWRTRFATFKFDSCPDLIFADAFEPL